jgi:pimeloyl-ACP methyl ester carboxylesterase
MLAQKHGRGPPVVLLHGQPGSTLDWHQVVPILSPQFTTIVPDRLGYGRTGGTAAGFEANAVALSALLDRLAVRRALIVGHSWGGGVALAFAEIFPERTAGLVLAASIGPGERFGWQDRVLAAPFVGELLAGLTLGVTGRLLASERMQALADRHLRGRAREALNVLAGLTGARTGAAVWRSFVLEQRVLLRDLDTLGPALAAITVPAEVINGSADRIVPPLVAADLATHIPGAVHTVLPGAHHLLLREHPDAVAAAIRRVAGRAWNPGASEVLPSDVQETPDREIGAQNPDRGPDHQQQDSSHEGLVRGDVELS